MRLHLAAAVVVLSIFFSASTASAQITNVTGETQTPTPQSGRNYIQMLNEIVDPATGSLSVRISVPTAPGRKLSLPFAFAYDSRNAWFVEPYTSLTAGPNYGIGVFQKGGWSYAVPQLSSVGMVFVPTIVPPFSPPSVTGCFATGSYVFEDASGGRHALGLSHIDNVGTIGGGGGSPPAPPTDEKCSGQGYYFSEQDSGGDGNFQATLVGATTATGYSNGALNSDGTPILVDADGTVYNFGSNWGCGLKVEERPQSTPMVNFGLPAFVEDRNGNVVNFSVTYGNNSDCLGSSFSEYDAIGGVVSATAFGQTGSTVSVPGLTNPYTLTWSTVSTTGLSLAHNQLLVDADCPGVISSATNMGAPVVTAIELPDEDQSYAFGYDPVTGFVNQITYPSGGVVTYTWGISPESAILNYNDDDTEHAPNSCIVTHDTPAVTKRVVMFDGHTPALEQDFTYTTTWGTTEPYGWTGKTTTVVTKDLVRNTSFTTTYAYAPLPVNEALDQAPANVLSQSPVEQTIKYYATTNIGLSPLKTTTKNWKVSGYYGTTPLVGCEMQTLDNGTTIGGTFYSYGNMGVLTEKKDYDFGQLGTTSYCSTNEIPPTSPAPIRDVVINYQTFGDTPIFPYGASIVDRPSSIVTSGNGSPEAETDYAYDQALTSAVSPLPHDHDEYCYAPSPTSPCPILTTIPRGNATTMTKQCFPSCSNQVSTYAYDETGQVLSATDPKGNATSFSFTDSSSSCSGTPPSGITNAYVTQITYPATSGVSHIANFCYGYNDGLLRSSADENNQVTSYTYGGNGDLLDRLTAINYPDGGQTTFAYNDASYNSSTHTPNATTTKEISSGLSVTSIAAVDGVGHAVFTELTNDPDGAGYTVSSYDGLGHTYTVTNPYRTTSDSTYGVTTSYYDALGRTTIVVPPDGTLPTGTTCPHPSNDVCTTYSGNTTTVTDEAGISRQSTTDALGRLTQVIENPGGLAYVTTYTYDALNDLTGVLQNGSRPRTFAYNSLAQLTSATNPESSYASSTGTTVPTTYVYDADGNLASKTMPAQNQTSTATVTLSYCYDALNRILSKAYTNQSCPMSSPVASYFYDQSSSNGLTVTNGIGRRTGMTDAAGNEAWSYDVMGRVLTDQRTTNSITKSTAYAYLPYVDGSVNTVTYPSGRVFTYTTGAADRLTSVVDSSVNYATAAHYTAGGALAGILNGTNLNSTFIFNNRLQPCWIYATTSATLLATNSLCTAADPGPASILDLQYNFHQGTGDNENVWGITNNRDTTRSQTYAYDALNRLLTAETTSTHATSPTHCWGESYLYDNQPSGSGAWGNLTNINVASTSYTGCTQAETLSATASVQNQLSTNGYDTAGNAITYGTASYTYNAENQLTQAAAGSTAGYVYDGDGKRVEKTSSGTPYKLYWYGAGGDTLDETDQTGVITNNNFSEYVFFGGKRIARRDSASHVFYFTADHLGTSREIVLAGQTSPCYDADFYPFGGERAYTTTCSPNYKFTGKERDSESNLDNFGARYDASSIGRFMTPDSTGFTKPINPQSWNLYAYAWNNPLLFSDPTGHEVSLANCQDVQKCVQVLTNAAQLPKGVTADVNKKGLLELKGDLSKIKGGNALRLMQLVNSDKRANFWIGDKAPGLGGAQTQDVRGGLSGTTGQGYNQNFAVVQADPSTVDSGDLHGAFLNSDGSTTGGDIPGANIEEAAAHELLGHVWADLIGGQSAGAPGNLKEALIAEDRVRNTDPSRGVKTYHHDYNSALIGTSDLPRITNPGSQP